MAFFLPVVELDLLSLKPIAFFLSYIDSLFFVCYVFSVLPLDPCWLDGVVVGQLFKAHSPPTFVFSVLFYNDTNNNNIYTPLASIVV